MTRARALIAAAVLTATAAPAVAWETTTHVGLAEQAALAANLDAWLRALGHRGGLFEPLTVPPADAPELFAALAAHTAIDGYVPDLRGQQTALAWLLAGAALADATPAWAANHFFDPTTGAGWRAPARSWLGRLDERLRRQGGGPSAGRPAPDWIVADDNPLGMAGWVDQYDKAVRAATPGERARHLAGALVAAGAMLHVLGDLGGPSRVRGDAAAHFDDLGRGERGSRFERLVAIAYGRLGVPAATDVPSRSDWRAYFTSDGAGTRAGLAEWTGRQFFSEHTLPRPAEVGRASGATLAAVLARAQVRPLPQVTNQLSMVVATQRQGATLRDLFGVCLARYRKVRGTLSWWLDDDCLLEQARVILPVVAGYQAGLLRWLGRGQLAMTVADGKLALSARGTALGAGTLTVLTEDGRGVRTPVATVELSGAADGAALGAWPVPAGVAAAAVFRGVDGAGQPVVAVGHLMLP